MVMTVLRDDFDAVLQQMAPLIYDTKYANGTLLLNKASSAAIALNEHVNQVLCENTVFF